MTFLFFNRNSVIISKTIAATPKATGTKITSQVGLSTQFDYTSQNSVPKKDRQQPPRQKLGSAHPFVSTMIILPQYIKTAAW